MLIGLALWLTAGAAFAQMGMPGMGGDDAPPGQQAAPAKDPNAPQTHAAHRENFHFVSPASFLLSLTSDGRLVPLGAGR